MKRRLRELYDAIKRAHLGAWAGEVPARYHATFVNVGGAAELVDFHRRLLAPLVARRGGPLRVLVVGVYGGRDFWGLRVLGHDVVGLDLNPAPDCPPTVVGDAEQIWPFDGASFDAVVMCEILEHLFDDVAALRQARRVLRPDGALLVTVPFVNDAPEWHVRVHTPRSIRRLLARAGFEVDTLIERPGLWSLRGLNPIHHALAAAWFGLTGRSAYPGLVRGVAAVEWRLQQRRVPRHLIRLLAGANWGCTLRARAVEAAFDHTASNREAFGSAPPSSSSAPSSAS